MQQYTAVGLGASSEKIHLTQNFTNLFNALEANAEVRQRQAQRELVEILKTSNKELAKSFIPAALAESTAVAVKASRQLETVLSRSRKQAAELEASAATVRELSQSAAPVLAALTALHADVKALRAGSAHLREDNQRLRDSLTIVMEAQEAAERSRAVEAKKRAYCTVQ